MHVFNSGKNDFSKFIDVEDHAGGVGLADLIDLVVGAILDHPCLVGLQQRGRQVREAEVIALISKITPIVIIST